MLFATKMRNFTCTLLLGMALSAGLSLKPVTAASVTVNGAAANSVDQIAGTFHQLNAATTGTILDLNVSVHLGSFNEWGDLDMFIVHNGISVQLLDHDNPNDCCSGGLAFDVTFDDGSANILGSGASFGSFKPQNGFLSAFNGQNLAGIWELQIFEEYGLFENETDLLAWSITADITAIPLPAALPLYGAGLAVIGFIGWRHKRKAHSTA